MDRCVIEWPGRALLPRTVVRLSRAKRRFKGKALFERMLGISGTIEFYFAFDDPYSAIALPKMMELVSDRELEIELFPLAEHGIPGDPDIDKRRAYSLADAARLGKRLGVEINRTSPLDPDKVLFLAAWAESAREVMCMDDFSERAMAMLWARDQEPGPGSYVEIYERTVGIDPLDDPSEYAEELEANLKRLRRKGHWEVPAALVYGQWYFAHERLEAIEERLDFLGR